MHDGFDGLWAFGVSSYLYTPLVDRAIYTATFVTAGGTTESRYCGHTCAGEALHWVYCKRSQTEITTPEKEKVCIALALFFVELLVLFQPQKHWYHWYNHKCWLCGSWIFTTFFSDVLWVCGFDSESFHCSAEIMIMLHCLCVIWIARKNCFSLWIVMILEGILLYWTCS